MTFIKKFVGGGLPRSRETKHVYLQLYFLRGALPLDFLGNLSTSDADSKRFGLPVIQGRHDKSHESTKADSGNAHRTAVVTLLDINPTVKCALVRALIADYVCFGWPAPSPCEHVMASTSFRCPYTPREIAKESSLALWQK